jgi:hypothetical protein
MDMRIRYRGHTLDLRLMRDSFTIRGRETHPEPITVEVRGSECTFVGGSTRSFSLASARGISGSRAAQP